VAGLPLIIDRGIKIGLKFYLGAGFQSTIRVLKPSGIFPLTLPVIAPCRSQEWFAQRKLHPKKAWAELNRLAWRENINFKGKWNHSGKLPWVGFIPMAPLGVCPYRTQIDRSKHPVRGIWLNGLNDRNLMVVFFNLVRR